MVICHFGKSIFSFENVASSLQAKSNEVVFFSGRVADIIIDTAGEVKECLQRRE